MIIIECFSDKMLGEILNSIYKFWINKYFMCEVWKLHYSYFTLIHVRDNYRHEKPSGFGKIGTDFKMRLFTVSPSENFGFSIPNSRTIQDVEKIIYKIL